MPNYGGFPPDEVEDLKDECIRLRFDQPSAILGTRAFARGLMQKGWRRRNRLRLRPAPPLPSLWEGHVTGWLELTDGAGAAVWRAKLPPMPAEVWQQLAEQVGPG